MSVQCSSYHLYCRVKTNSLALIFLKLCSYQTVHEYKVKDPDENIANDVDDEAGLFVVLWLVWIISCGGYTLATLTVASMFTRQTGGQNSTSAVTDNYVDTHFGIFF